MCVDRILVLVTLAVSALGNERCPPPELAPKFHLVEKCQRSQLGAMASANFASLESCRRLAVARRALALNFSPPEAAALVEYDESEPFHSCEVLKCPESDVGLSLVNDSRYDYYSMYANPLPNVHTSCISRVGIFSIERKPLNYTEASDFCKRLEGDLADPSSETRTNELALLISGRGLAAAFVGMRSENGSSFRTAGGESLECTTYRAWAPGHPKRRLREHSCVALDGKKMWKGVRCDKRMPFVCELFPNGPYVPGSLNRTTESGNKKDVKQINKS